MISPHHIRKNWLSIAKRLHPQFPPLDQPVFREEESQAFVINIVKSFFLERAHPREVWAKVQPRERNRILGAAHQHGLQ